MYFVVNDALEILFTSNFPPDLQHQVVVCLFWGFFGVFFVMNRQLSCSTCQVPKNTITDIESISLKEFNIQKWNCFVADFVLFTKKQIHAKISDKMS